MPASGEHSLPTLLKTLSPLLDATPFVYAHLPATQAPSASLLAQCRGAFYESHRQAWTLILPSLAAEAHYPASSPDASVQEARQSFWPCALITLDVHSSLEGVGFMAAISRALADEKIGCNPIAGWFSDHLFVAWEDRTKAVAVLNGLRSAAVDGTLQL